MKTITKRSYRNSANQGMSPYKEKNDAKSETVPDQSYTVREILIKFANGTLPNIFNEPQFSEDNPDLRGLDFHTIHEMRMEAKKDTYQLEKKYKEEQEAKRLKKLDKPKNSDDNESNTEKV